MATIRHPTQAAPKINLIRVPGDYATPQDAIDNASDGDCIFLASQTFEIDGPMRIAKPIHLMGENEMGERATIVFNGKSLKPAVPLLRIASSCRVQGVNFVLKCDETAPQSAKATEYALSITAGDFLMSDCGVTTECGGIFVANGSYTSLSAVSVEAKFVGVDVRGKVYMDRCHVKSCIAGIRVATLCSCTAERCVIDKCTIGVDIGKHSSTVVKASTITGCVTGVSAEDDTPSPKPPEIRGNSISNCVSGVYTTGEGCTCDISKNLVSHCSEAGICIDGGLSFVNSNAVSNCPLAGIDVREGRPQVSCNVIDDCAKNGILVAGVKSSPIVLSNEIARCKGAGILVVDGAAPRVETNVMSENEINISIDGALGLYKRNELLVSHQESVIVRHAEANIVFEENEVMGSVMSCGVCITDNAHAIVAGNMFAGTKLTAIVLRGCGATDVHDNEMDPATCQAGAVVAQKGAVARIHNNNTNGLEVTVFSDSTESTTTDQ